FHADPHLELHRVLRGPHRRQQRRRIRDARPRRRRDRNASSRGVISARDPIGAVAAKRDSKSPARREPALTTGDGCEHRTIEEANVVAWRVPVMVATGLASWLIATPGSGTGHSFTQLQSGFTQDLYATTTDLAPYSVLGGVAFAPDGRVW